MKKLTILLLLIISFNSYSQVQMGYLTGTTFRQPIYGITLQKQFNKYFNLESNVLYSQRMLHNSNKIQADYLQFMINSKFGYFGTKLGIYGGYGFSLNPTLNHTNPENHTYVSFIPNIGLQVTILPKVIIDLKAIYDIGLVPGHYIIEQGWDDPYKALIIMTTLKFQIK